MSRWRRLSLAILSCGIVLGAWAFGFEPASLTTRKHELRIPFWNEGLAGLRVAVLSDLHVGSPYNGVDKLRRIVELTNAQQPELVLIPGDFVIQEVLGGRFVPPEDAAAILAGLKAPLGVWATLGNHDWWLDGKRVIAALEKLGIGVLEDAAVRIRRGKAAFWLVGIGDFWEAPHDVKKALRPVSDDAPVLMFTHHPDLFPELTNRFSLLVAGHTHGGQVYLPFIGRPVIPSRYGQRYAYGHIVENGRHLFVSPGLGTSILPVRFLVPPEITVLELHPS